MAKTVAAVFLAFAASAKAGPECPSSGSWIHASTSVEVTLMKATCNTVMSEMMARVGAQPAGWHDPHNNGTYALTSGPMDLPKVELTRVTGDGKYTDKILFTCQDGGCGPAGCSAKLSGCSASQVFSVADFSTNYCNLRMLYCGSKAGCKPMTKAGDVPFEETSVSPSIGASHNPSDCLKLASTDQDTIV